MRIAARLALILIGVMALASCGGGSAGTRALDGPAPEVASVAVSERGFAPAPVRVRRGEVILEIRNAGDDRATISVSNVGPRTDELFVEARMVEPGEKRRIQFSIGPGRYELEADYRGMKTRPVTVLIVH